MLACLNRGRGILHVADMPMPLDDLNSQCEHALKANARADMMPWK